MHHRYGITVGIEFASAGLGAAILGVTGQPSWIGVWICAVVGAQFIPLATILADRSLVYLGALLLTAAIAATVSGALSTFSAATHDHPVNPAGI